MADRLPHRGGDAAHLRRRRAPLCRRAADTRRAGLAARDPPVVGAGTVHLHVHLDGEVRRRVRRAHRHPRRRRRPDQRAARIDPAQVHPRRTAGGGAVHGGGRHAWRQLRMGDRPHRPDVGRPRIAAVDRLPVHSLRLLPDVLPLPPGGVALRAHRRAAEARSRLRRRPGRRRSAGRHHRRFAPLRQGERPPRDDAGLALLVISARGDDRAAAAGHCAGHQGADADRDLPAAVRADADRHADLDLARPHRAHLPVHDDERAGRRRWR